MLARFAIYSIAQATLHFMYDDVTALRSMNKFRLQYIRKHVRQNSFQQKMLHQSKLVYITESHQESEIHAMDRDTN